MQWILMADAGHWAPADAGGQLLAAFAQATAPVAVTALWQGAAVVVALVLCLRLAPRVSAAHRFVAWAGGFVAVVCLPFLFPIAHGALGAAAPDSSAMGEAAAKPWFELSSSWALGVAALWLAAAALRAADLAFHTLRLRRLWKTATPVEAGAGVDSLLAGGVGRRRPVEVCTTRKLDRPSVIGFLAPRILIPEWLFERLTPKELELVVLHEAEHLRRHDDWSNLLQKLCLVVFPLNPALAWMERRLCREREMACDEWVVRRTQEPRAYAACLASLAERGMERRAEALSLSTWRRRPELVHRVQSILRRKRMLNPAAARALVGVVCCGLILGIVELAHCPQLVAFDAVEKVAAPQRAAEARTNAAAARAGWAAYAQTGNSDLKRGGGGLRDLETKTIARGRHGAGRELAATWQRRVAGQSADAAEGEMAATDAGARDSGTGASRQVLAKAEMSAAAAAPVREQEYIVFAAWEEVRTFPQKTKEAADYDTGATAQQTGEAQCRPDAETTTRITVTQVILRVYPVRVVPGAKAATASGSTSGRPIALPFDTSWLVLEL